MNTYIDANDYMRITGEVVEQQGKSVNDFDTLARAGYNFVNNYCGQILVADTKGDKFALKARVYDGRVDFGVSLLKEGLEVKKDSVVITDYTTGLQDARGQDYIRYIEVDDLNNALYTIMGYVGVMKEVAEDIKIASALYIQFIRDKLQTQDNLESEGIGALSLRYFENDKGFERVTQLLEQYTNRSII